MNISRTGIAGLFLYACCAWVGCAAEDPPSLLPIDAQEITVNQTLVLPLAVSNPSGVPVTYSYRGPALPSLDVTATLSGTPSGAEFRWTPLSSHVGNHQFDFVLTADSGESVQSVIITVKPQVGAAPIFIQPGNGGTFNLDVGPCVRFELEVKDDDSDSVEIRPNAELPFGASIEPLDDKRSRFGWCPTEAQVNQSLSWILRFVADDGEHAATEHTYHVVLRQSANSSCPGDNPQVEITSPAPGATLTSSAGFPIRIEVSDDTEVRDAPILYYTLSEPDADKPDLSTFEVTAFDEGEADGEWVAAVPPPASGVSAPVWFIVSVVDNDDETGTACDHRTDTPVAQFTAEPEGGKAGACGLCASSDTCDSGICAAKGVCAAACNACAGDCVDVTTVEGLSLESCGGLDSCNDVSPVECEQDALANNTVEDALSLLGGALEGTICSGDESDYFRFTSGLDMNVKFLLEDLDIVDLDLELLDEQGNVLSIASTAKAIETASYCVDAGSVTYARVYSYKYAPKKQGKYRLSGEAVAGACCENDASEPDNSISAASPAEGSFGGTLCPSDTDHVVFEVKEPSHVEVQVNWSGEVKFVDIALYGPLPDETNVGQALGNEGKTQFNGFLTEPGSYVIAILPFGSKPGAYEATITLGQDSGCDFTPQCPAKTVCKEKECVLDTCGVGLGLCPLGHTCAALTAPSGIFGKCAFDCVINGECREDQGERCKWLNEGRSCAQSGTKKVGEACKTYEDCADQNACHWWPGGYCARLGCATSADCKGGTRCSFVDGTGVCLRECTKDSECRLSEGYFCDFFTDFTGGFFTGCGFGSNGN